MAGWVVGESGERSWVGRVGRKELLCLFQEPHSGELFHGKARPLELGFRDKGHVCQQHADGRALELLEVAENTHKLSMSAKTPPEKCTSDMV